MGLRDLAAFMTALPLGGGSLEAAARSFHMAPVIGALGGLVAGSAAAALEALGVGEALLLGAVYMAVHLAFTGGLHMDGFADYADVVGSRLRGGEALRVLKDPRRGSFAAAWTAVVVLVGAASAGLIASELSGLEAVAVVAAVHAGAAEAAYTALASGRPEPYRGLARVFREALTPRSMAVNALVYAAVGGLCVAAAGPGAPGAAAIIALLASPIVGYAAARDASSRLGFVSGDVAGFAFESSRTLCLLAAALVASSWPSS